ncbi:MAG: hypothetical protein FE048_00450 [Thermoplasmata archaeon]|nr:MAG: hypothetical protein FE048_00450 [Thermoplasmata archaeon]
MVFTFRSKGKEYTLYTREVKLKGGKIQRIYFFSARKPKSGVPTDKPEGYNVKVNLKTGLPFLKKK